jgi:ribosomal-protein-alanine N-acetyltransferase
MNVAVDPEHRREGVATALIKRLLDEIEGIDKVMLEVRGSNEPAIEMYQGFGFDAVGYRRRYYQDNGEDALVMELERRPKT